MSSMVAILSVYSGGPGSGCQGENCGRPKSKLQEMLEKFAESSKGKFQRQTLWELLSQYGHPGNVETFTKEEMKELKDVKSGHACKLGFCFMNAQRIATDSVPDDKRFQYVEGLVTVHGVPIDHAWIEFNGKVYDPTLFKYSADGQLTGKAGSKEDPSDVEYFGVTVPKDQIWKNQLATGKYSPLSHNWKDESLQKQIWRKQ